MYPKQLGAFFIAQQLTHVSTTPSVWMRSWMLMCTAMIQCTHLPKSMSWWSVSLGSVTRPCKFWTCIKRCFFQGKQAFGKVQLCSGELFCSLNGFLRWQSPRHAGVEIWKFKILQANVSLYPSGALLGTRKGKQRHSQKRLHTTAKCLKRFKQ